MEAGAEKRGMSPIARAFRENETAIKRLLARFLPRRSDVEDLAQETFLRAFAAEATQEIVSPRAFLFTTARNLALNEAQRMANISNTSLEDFPAPDVLGSDSQVSGDETLYSRQKMMVFAEAVSALPEQCRRVFLLRKVHGLSQKEVAGALGIAESTVEKQVAAGLLRTSEFLRGRGFELPQKRQATRVEQMPRLREAGASDGR
jgi:RNA polymerase sigma-70 factor (ECF subfamily)